MAHFTLDSDDIKACLELACDGIDLHLQDPSKLEVLHKIMYAVADAVQNDQGLVELLEDGEDCGFRVLVRGYMTKKIN